MLIETPDGFVIVDHKTYSGKDALERTRQYAPQLFAYRRAVEAASGRKVASLLLHLPICGKVVEIRDQ